MKAFWYFCQGWIKSEGDSKTSVADVVAGFEKYWAEGLETSARLLENYFPKAAK